MIKKEHVELLKDFVNISNKNPSILHLPELAFYKKYLENLGAKILPSTNTSEKTNSETKSDCKTENAEPSKDDEPEIPYPELDNSKVISEEDDINLPMGDLNKEIADDDIEKSNNERDLALNAMNNGNYDEALQHYTKAIEFNPGLAILHAKRANILLKLNKPSAAIRDCDHAITLNADSAQAYKFRGRAYGLLGKYLEAYNDLVLACKIDYDESASQWLKEIEPNAKKLQEYNRALERRKLEKELRERQERVRRAQEANKKAAEDAKKFAEEQGTNNMPKGEFPGSALFNDPELIKMLENDPSLLQKLSDVMQNPQNMMKYIGDPTVQKLMAKVAAMKGAGGGFPFPGFGGFDADSKTGNTDSTKSQPKKTPEPDLD